ncbi:hypothetical protein [Spiroplasma sp. SV19]|uniref:hypothetical protein n=1 Tax=Spiroplasma sp. SV19 TaxID=2570468 RepID=UPI0024B85C96|nr:hypothetical protein [Spiroplasma sp. SV19]WHQ36697.1 hypothetical protein E7Y35_02135 [Spiroplasma sp. SV19]
MNNSGVKTTEGVDNHSISFGPNNNTTSDSLFNQKPPLTPLSKPIKVPTEKDGFKADPNPAFNPSYISQSLGINGTSVQAQYNKPIYQPIIYQPYVMPVMNNTSNVGGMNQYGMMPQYPGMMMGYPQMPQYPGMMMGYPQMPQYPGMMMGYPQMPQYPGMMMGYPPLAGPDLTQQYQSMPQYSSQETGHSGVEGHGRDDNNHFTIMNSDLMKQQQKNDDDFAGFNNDFNDEFDDDFAPFTKNLDSDDNNDFGSTPFTNPDFNQNNNFNSPGNNFAAPGFNAENNFGQLNSSFSPTNSFNDQGASFGPTPDFNAAPSFNTPTDFNPASEFDANGAVLGKIDPVKMPFAQNNELNQTMNNPNVVGYDEEPRKRRLPIWAIVLIVVLAVLIVAIVTIIMLYFNLDVVHDLINGWFGLDVPFDPWF